MASYHYLNAYSMHHNQIQCTVGRLHSTVELYLSLIPSDIPCSTLGTVRVVHTITAVQRHGDCS